MTLLSLSDLLAVLTACRDVGDMVGPPGLLSRMMLLDLWADRIRDAATHLGEAVQLGLRTGSWVLNYLGHCGHQCTATGRHAEALALRGLLTPRWFRPGRLAEGRAAQACPYGGGPVGT